MASILVKMGRIYRNQFKCDYLNNYKHFLKTWLRLFDLHFENKKEPHSLSISQITESKKRGYLKS